MSLRSTIRAFFTAGKAVVGGLSEESAGTDPLFLFQRWFEEAKGAGIYLPESMTLATVDGTGQPTARLVLLKAWDERGFVFYTNYDSDKAVHLAGNPRAALVFHWPILQRQVRLQGSVAKVPTEESEAYFRTRPRGSQLGAWASQQSAVLAGRQQLEERFREYEGKFRGQAVPLPPFWGGYRLQPVRFEFWQGRVNRLHDRIVFLPEGEGWSVKRLYP